MFEKNGEFSLQKKIDGAMSSTDVLGEIVWLWVQFWCTCGAEPLISSLFQLNPSVSVERSDER